MTEYQFSDEANFLYSLFLKKYNQNKINDHRVMFEEEDYEENISSDAVEIGLTELKEQHFIIDYKSFIDALEYVGCPRCSVEAGNHDFASEAVVAMKLLKSL